MKAYDFKNRKREAGHVVFALTLDRKKLTERIIIGRVDEVRQFLNGGDADVYFDQTRLLGSLLVNFESDIDGDWNKKISPLCESYSKTFPRESARWKMVEPVQKFLTEKYNSGEPSAMFAAIRTWEEYLRCFNESYGADLLGRGLFTLYKPFQVYAEHKPWRDEAVAALSVALQSGESAVELWYPVAKRPFETVVAISSFLPLISYYMHKITEWKLVFRECKVCGKFFIARSRHYEICSDACKKTVSAQAKREYDERVKGDDLEQLYENAYYYWYNRWRKLKKKNADHAAEFKVALDNYSKGTVKHKASVKRGDATFDEFSAWIFAQQGEADRLMDEYASKML